MKFTEHFQNTIPFNVQAPVGFDWFGLLKHGAIFDFDVRLNSHPQKLNLQRPLVWSLQQKQQLIFSVLKAIFLPPIAVIKILGTGDDIHQIIDGKQRLNALIGFADNEYSIEFEGKSYFWDDLCVADKSQLKYCLNAHEVLDFGGQISDKAKVDWFNLLNFSGTPQDLEHIKKINIYE